MRVDADHFRHSWISRERYGDEEGTSLHNKLYFRSDSFTGTRLCTFMLAVYAAQFGSCLIWFLKKDKEIKKKDILFFLKHQLRRN